jgi:SAM-dependent methyltransferase
VPDDRPGAAGPRFRAGLYQGKADDYDRFRLPYPSALIEDLVARTAPAGDGRLLDLACGTGQLAFPLSRWFAAVDAVDAEPDMTAKVRATAAASRSGRDQAGGGGAAVTAVTASAADFRAAPGCYELVVIGNAFHRLPRDLVAARAHDWLRPGGWIALCWTSGTQAGETDWQRAFAGVLGRWQRILGATDRVPQGWADARRRDPDRDVLARAGFTPAGTREFTAVHRWSISELAGFARSLSVLPAAGLARRGAEFDADLQAALARYTADGRLTETVSHACELARKPPAPAG